MPKQLFAEQPEAAELHEKGLALAAHHGAYEDADAAFSEALDILSRPDAGFTNLELTLQTARIHRDHAFTHLRSALSMEAGRGEQHNGLDAATSGLTASMEMTDDLLAQADRSFNSKRLAVFRSEHGATLSLVGRLTTATIVLGLGDVDPHTHISHYSQAAAYLHEGSNRYYEASNAMTAARALTIEQRPGVSVWLGVAVRSTMRALMSDSANFKPALRTVERRLPDLASVDIARRSVLVRP
jgi:hypothetical protein